jgi:ATP-dependent RNA helicase RhlE
MVPSDYVHRIGRTGRAGVTGTAVSLVCVDEAPLMRDIERMLRMPIRTEVIAGFEPDRSIRAEPIRLRTAGGRPGGGGHGRPMAGPRREANDRGRVRFGAGRPRRDRRPAGSRIGR